MKDSSYIRFEVALRMLHHVSPLIRTSLFENSHFRDEFGFDRNRVLEFDESRTSFERTRLYDAIRQVLSDESESMVTDEHGKEWRLTVKRDGSLSTSLEISHSNRRILLIPQVTLSSDKRERLNSINEIASDFNLPVSARKKWSDVVSKRPLEDDEVDKFYCDFCDTPIDVERSIYGRFKIGKVSVKSLVPSSRRYYERLVGAYDGSESIRDYAVGPGKQFFEQLSSWRPYDGFLYSLLLSSHSSLTTEIGVEHLASEDLVRAFRSLGEFGDRLSQLGAVEIGLRVLSDRPDVRPALICLTKQIRDDDAGTLTSGFKLLSALFLLVDGELARTRLLSEQPPFYRRLAALSQAALICRQFGNASGAIDSFCKWAVSTGRGARHNIQSLAEMRLEPRWYPNFSEAAQIKAHFYGRIVIAASECAPNILGDALHNLILSEDSGSIHSQCEIPRAYLPGPLEGAEKSFYIMAPELAKAIKDQLSADDIGILSLTALLNSASMFQLDFDRNELSAKVRALGSDLFTDIEDRSQLLFVLFGLASVAAVTRNFGIATEVRNLIRKCSRDEQYRLTVEDTVAISLIAAASRSNLDDWEVFVGECFTDLAFGQLADEERDSLYTHLQYLFHSVPELWTSCSKADAALKSLKGF